MDYVQQVARLIGENHSNLKAEADRVLARLEMEVTDLNDQAAMIKAMVARYTRSSELMRTRQLEFDVADVSDMDAAIRGLTESQRRIVNAVIEEALEVNPRVTADDILHELARRGVPLSVQKPGSVVGTMLWHTKRRAGGSSSMPMP